MYTTKVNVRKILGAKISDMVVFIPILLWGALTFISFLLFALGKKPAVYGPIFVVVFLCVIPVFIVTMLMSAKYKGSRSYHEEDVTFRTENGELYVGDVKINVLKRDENSGEFIVESVKEVGGIAKGVRFSSRCYYFTGKIEPAYAGDFCNFLLENGIRVGN